MTVQNNKPEQAGAASQTQAEARGPSTEGISVVIPAMNAEAFVGRAIDSALAQTLAPREIIVVDDGSTDGTRQVVQRYGERVRYLQQDNQGASAARNTGIRAASGEWIAFLDADDEWLPERLALQVRLLEENPLLNWLTGNFYRCRCRRGHRQFADLTGQRKQNVLRFLKGGRVFDSYFSAHRYGAMGCTDTMLIRKELLLEAGLFLPGQKRINDVDMWLRIAYLRQPIGYVFEPLAVYHLDVKGSILKKHRDADSIDQFLQRHFELARQAGMLEAFRPCTAAMLGWWLGRRLEDGDGRQVRFLLEKYRELFSVSSFRKLYLMSYCPRTAAMYNRLKEHLRNRRENKVK